MLKKLKKQWQAPVVTVIVRDSMTQNKVLDNCKQQTVYPNVTPYNYQYGYCWKTTGVTCVECFSPYGS